MFIYAKEQIILVVGDDYDSKSAVLTCFEKNMKVFTPIKVNVGKRGFGWGEETGLLKKEDVVLKYEGDKKAPIGIFSIDALFGYDKNDKVKMPYIHATKEMICVDDSNSPFYNRIIKKDNNLPNSFEEMRRDDSQYKFGIVVGYNKNRLKQRGSCIFLHVQKAQSEPTAGCTSMREEDIKKIIKWLDKDKNPILIQVTKKEMEQVLKIYPALEF